MAHYEVIADGDTAVLTLLAEHDDGYQHQTVIAQKGDRFRTKDEDGEEPVISPVVVEGYEKEDDVDEEKQHVRKLLTLVASAPPSRAKKNEDKEQAA